MATIHNVDKYVAYTAAQETLKECAVSDKTLTYLVGHYLDFISYSFLVTEVSKCQGMYLKELGTLLAKD